ASSSARFESSGPGSLAFSRAGSIIAADNRTDFQVAADTCPSGAGQFRRSHTGVILRLFSLKMIGSASILPLTERIKWNHHLGTAGTHGVNIYVAGLNIATECRAANDLERGWHAG